MASTNALPIVFSPLSQPGPSSQPFRCQVCSSRFTRHENLKRHTALHSRSSGNASIPCHLCPATFSRSDLRHRHMKRKHLDQMEKASRRKQQRDLQALTPPSQADEGVVAHQPRQGQASTDDDGSNLPSTGWPGSRDIRTDTANLCSSLPSDSGNNHHPQKVANSSQSQFIPDGSVNIEPTILSTIDSQLLNFDFLEPSSNHQSSHMSTSPFGTSLLSFNLDQGSPERLLYGSIDLTQSQIDWHPSNMQIKTGCELYFKHVSHFLPFLHRPTFNSTDITSHLLLGMLCIGYQYDEDPDCNNQQGSGVELSERCFHRARALVSGEKYRTDGSTHNLSIVQSYLLLEIYAMMYLCGNHSAYGLKTHSKMISLARSSGLSLPIPSEPTATSDLDSLWHTCIASESQKRTLFAAHQIDTLWYQFLSIPRQFSHLEIKHELPCPEDQWMASSAAEWAHKKLVTSMSGSAVQYPDAIRRFLSSPSDLSSLPAFDPYGAINITHFLISSVQEVSGWCTMTGMISMERLEPLRTSLQALGAFIHSDLEHGNLSRGALCKASWESAMIEVRVWSPSHTSGIVGGTMDAFLQHSTYLPPSCEFLCESNTAKAIKPHIDWFLAYLDAPIVPDSEAPWIMLYAFKAFIIAWQLVQGSTLGSMEVVGVQDGDDDGALEWAKRVFGRRRRWQLGKIIMTCLDTLKTSVES
ncbi:unnamed protein product [Fusarium graminearum]|uniref:C2H2-type domain-containing protein n=1 Tax=Gibberella zeae TaxID=5518 RepID=A0A4V6JA14_GIBZA|nr:hypothetical protein HG531_013659 [Fusarium graminearum]CAF3429547.1 unnamed protein product [Fusarium graminearum]CAF3443557.1 unnamed protein product [Fusarium graminearum]CAG1964697.1 unnamed protein product [Fusarium graminearum]CAG2010599.1 unnamed protein product [Fusarium graminearum]